jgi:hypothetical protein
MRQDKRRQSSSDDQFRVWWERTFKEREETLRDTFGISDPPGWVHSFSWTDFDDMIPGACALAFPPQGRRDHWLYLSHGLTQPECKSEAKASEKSGYGYEFALITRERCEWPIDALYWILTYCKQSEQRLDLGHRLPFWFNLGANGNLLSTIGGEPENAHGATRAMLFWLYRAAPNRFITETGYFWILSGTTITSDEWQLAKDTSSVHLLLLLLRAGVGQICDVARHSVLDDPEGRATWNKLQQLSLDEAESQLEAALGQNSH